MSRRRQQGPHILIHLRCVFIHVACNTARKHAACPQAPSQSIRLCSPQIHDLACLLHQQLVFGDTQQCMWILRCFCSGIHPLP